MATIENITYLKSGGFFGQQNLMEANDLNNLYLLNNRVLKSPMEGRGGGVILNYLNRSNHNPEIIWRIRMKSK